MLYFSLFYKPSVLECLSESESHGIKEENFTLLVLFHPLQVLNNSFRYQLIRPKGNGPNDFLTTTISILCLEICQVRLSYPFRATMDHGQNEKVKCIQYYWFNSGVRDLIDLLVSILCTSMTVENISGYKLEIQNVCILFNSSSIKGIIIENIQELNRTYSVRI